MRRERRPNRRRRPTLARPQAHPALDSKSSPRITPGEGDVLLSPAYWHDVDPDLYRSYKAAGCRIVILVHDILPIVFDRFYRVPWRFAFKDGVIAAFSYADAFFCVSHYTQACLVEFGVRQKLAMPPMMVAYNGYEPLVSEEGRALMAGLGAPLQPRESSVREPFEEGPTPFLMVGSIEPKKGHTRSSVL